MAKINHGWTQMNTDKNRSVAGASPAAAFGADFETERDGFLDVLERLRPGLALAHATGNGRAFSDPNAVLVAVKCHRKFHDSCLTHEREVCKRPSGQRMAWWYHPQYGLMNRRIFIGYSSVVLNLRTPDDTPIITPTRGNITQYT